MKNLLLFALLSFTIGFSQPMTVSTSSHTVPQLVNNVLINSPCVSATNITWSTGSNFGSSNGIGFFQNTNPNFPMQAGVILSTGNALNAAGPNTSMLNDGTAAWPGDLSLNATLNAAGIPMTSINASVLEFDFTPISSNFGFDFVFASEEYGNFQCQYSDAFAFLLTNMNTGVTTNLAVLPNTTTPISVVTIRNFLYNSSCASVNPQFFGSFNGGSAASSSATNFNGQTVVLAAGAVVEPGVPYHIKLVVADRLDPQSDSAIFISSNSFNIGQSVLGNDLTVATNTAICNGSTYTINTGLDPDIYSFTWSNGESVIADATDSFLTVTQSGTYSVTYHNIFSSCPPVIDEILLEYYPQITSPNPTDLYRCDSGATSYIYNLAANTSIVKQGLNPNTVVSYHASQSEANLNQNPLSQQYNSPAGTTVFVRIQTPNGCFIVKPFQLLVTPGPTYFQAPDIYKCSRSTTLLNQFIQLNQQTAAILNGQSSAINAVTYYYSLNDANTGVNAISNPAYVLLSTTVIYVRVQNISDPNCFSVGNFNVYVTVKPPVSTVLNVLVCESYTLPVITNGNYFTEIDGGGTMLNAGDVITVTQTIHIFNQPGGPNTCSASSSFTVTIIDPNTFGPSDVNNCGSYTLPGLSMGKYFTQPSGAGSEITPGTVISNSRTIYVYFVTTTTPSCTVDTSFEVTIFPALTIGNRPDVFDCTSYTLPPLTIGNYFTGPNGTGEQIQAGTVLTDSQTVVYVYAATSVCNAQDSFRVVIGMPARSDINQCNGYTLPQLPIGNYYTGPMGTGTIIPKGTWIGTNMTIYIYAPTLPGQPNCTDNMFFTLTFAQPEIDIINSITVCESYTLPTLTNGEYFTAPEGTGNMLYAGDVILNTQTIYIFRRLDATCYNEINFTVTVTGVPLVNSRSDIDICHQYILTELSSGQYFTGPNGTGTVLPAGTVITSSQQIYIYAISETTPPCISENSFQINIFSTTADDPADVVACDSYVLPALTTGSKYFTQIGGLGGSGTQLQPGTVITTTSTIYVYKELVIRTSFICFDENSFTVTINSTPMMAPIPNQNACNSKELPELSVGNYYTGPNATGSLLAAGTLITTPQTIYVYAETNTTPNCSAERSFFVNVFNVDELPDVTVCQNFTLPQLTVGKYYTSANGNGTQLFAGNAITTSQTIYIYLEANFLPRCSDESSFTVTVVTTPIANAVPVASRTTCDEDGVNDGITSFTLSTLTSFVLGNQSGAEFTVSYYATMADAMAQTNAIVATTATNVFVRVNNTLVPSCYDIKPLTLKVNKLPEPSPKDGFVCIDIETGDLLNSYTMFSGLSTAGHTFLWENEQNETVSTSTAYTATAPGIYTLTATSTLTGCASEPFSVIVEQSEPAEIKYEVEDDFASTQRIIVTVTGTGVYEYKLDNGVYQDSNIFENVKSGIHTITVRDKNGCGESSIQALVINYPKFFTPNGDGYNDTWNITDLSNFADATIVIYDRYGKIMKQIKPNGQGWDGNYNGNLMMSDDYWFTVNYTDENQANRQFRAHFAMKR